MLLFVVLLIWVGVLCVDGVFFVVVVVLAFVLFVCVAFVRVCSCFVFVWIGLCVFVLRLPLLLSFFVDACLSFA